jgi:hypothetical protein
MPAIGNALVTTPAGLNAQIGSFAVGLRSMFDAIDNFMGWFETLQLTDIESLFGVSADNAAVIQSSMGNLEALSQVYQGNATQPATLNFKANSAILWGGQ